MTSEIVQQQDAARQRQDRHSAISQQHTSPLFTATAAHSHDQLATQRFSLVIIAR
jgi:hypothetical protein